MTGVNEIRTAFLDYFAKHGHEIVGSGPLVPINDPTLLFTNSGMVQFKNVFTGAEKRTYDRAVTSQKCVRAGGKHNDLDNVGYTARHHTFFEMMGNFSFGDYFKDVAIELAWNLCTKECGLDPERMLATVYAQDDQAFDLWKKISGLPESKIIRIATSDNFWAMGDTGPCGPCSEIFFDHGEHIPGGPPGSPDEDGDRYIEIWNLVFMQFEQLTPDERVDLPKPSIDTGMGLERISAVLQGTHDNYETDLFAALIAASEDATNVAAKGKNVASHRVIADHLRAACFLIADGVLPSNEGRGYVLRRIMRRAMRHAQLLGAREPLIYKLVPALLREMGQAFPELIRAKALITDTLHLEETRFRKTLERGIKLLDDASSGLGKGDTLSGDVAFKLYDTYGFPLDLTQDALKSRGIEVDLARFGKAMDKQRADARKAWAGTGDAATEKIWFDLKERHGATEFLGYETEAAEGEVLALVKDGAEINFLKQGEAGAVILNQTPFYGESGGQVGDKGVIASGDGAVFNVATTQKKADGMRVHAGKLEMGPRKVGEAAELSVDKSARTATRANHSATHLLHEALRQVLGDHVAQKGSLVEPARLRFDYAHPRPMSDEEIGQVEDMANTMILQNSAVETRLMDVDEAIESGARALFGEKYGDEVRVVSMGKALNGDAPGKAYSVELCGGTHVARTGDVGLVKIIAESAVAAGVRRIEALTGAGARNYLSAQDARLRAAANLLKIKPGDVVERLQLLLDERKKLERDLSEAKKKNAGVGIAAKIDTAGPVKILKYTLHGVSVKDLRGLVDEGKKKIGSGIVAIIGVSEEGKAGLVVGVTDDLTSDYDAVALVKTGAEALGGQGGGGRPDMAQAGGPNGGEADAALQAIARAVREQAGG